MPGTDRHHLVADLINLVVGLGDDTNAMLHRYEIFLNAMHTVTGHPAHAYLEGPDVTDTRCPAAHPDDPTPCDGPAVVTVLDASNAGADGCEHHAARLLASLERGRVYGLPDAPPGAAIRVHKAAGDTRPFAWMDGQS